MQNHLLLSHVSEISFVAPPNDGVHMCPRTTTSKIIPPLTVNEHFCAPIAAT